MGKREGAPLNHAHMRAPHCSSSSGVSRCLHTVNLTHEIIIMHNIRNYTDVIPQWHGKYINRERSTLRRYQMCRRQAKMRPERKGCHAVDSPPSKVVPSDCPRQNNRSPRTKYCSHPWSPPAANGPPGCRLRLQPFRNCNAFFTALAYGDTPGRCLLDQNKVRQHLIEYAGGGDDTTPIEEESA